MKGKSKNGISKRLLCIALSLAMVIAMVPADAFAATQARAANYAPKAWVEGYADESRTNFRSSQMLVVKTSGFAPDAKLNYHYVGMSDQREVAVFNYGLISPSLRYVAKFMPRSEGGGLLDGLLNSMIDLTNSIREEEQDSSSPYFATLDTPAVNMSLKIIVSDTNPGSPTYKKSVEVICRGFEKADLSKDLSAPYAMFAGEVKTIPHMLATAGVGHIYPECETCATISSVKISNMNGRNTVSVSNTGNYSQMKVTASEPGLAKIQIAASKADTCSFHPGTTGVGDSYIRVFKKPSANAVVDGFDLTNTEAGVTYTIAGISKTCETDNETLSFRGLANGCDYEIQCSDVLPNGIRAKATIMSRTLDPHWVNFSYAYKDGMTSEPETQGVSLDGVSSAIKPEGPYADGYFLSGWYADSLYQTEYDFNSYVTSDQMIYGKWEPFFSSATVVLTKDKEAFTERTVQLYQDGKYRYTLIESEDTAGTYQLEDTVENGEYNIFVDGNDTGAKIKVASKKNKKTLSEEDFNARLTHDVFTAKVNITSLNIKTYLNDELTDKLGGTITCVDENGIVSTTTSTGGNHSMAIWDKNTKSYDIYYNGSDADQLGGTDKSKNISASSSEKRLDFYELTANIKSDDSEWESDTVVLRDASGRLVAKMKPGIYDAETQTRPYTYLMLKDEKDTPAEYSVFVDGVDTGKKLTSTEDGHTAALSYYLASITLKQDEAPKADAEIQLSNGKYNYTVTNAPDGVYKMHLLIDEEEEQEKAYTFNVTNTIDSDVHTIDTGHAAQSLEYCSVTYYSYESSDNGLTYNKKDRPNRTQIVRKGQKTSAATAPYAAGLSFEGWSTSAWDWENGNMPTSFFDFDAPIDGSTTLYAQFSKPEVRINGYVKSDENGAINAESDHYTTPNLTIKGFDAGNSIKSVLLNFSNIESVKYPALANAQITLGTSSTGESLSSGKESSEGSALIVFDEKVSMTAAQNYLRSIVVKPKQDVETTVKITVSDGVISAGGTSVITPVPTNVNWTKITSGGSNMTLSSGNYYIANNVTYTGTSGNPGLTISGNVNLYIPAGVTLTATGADGSGRTPGAAGILLASGNTLNIYGAGKVVAKGGNAGNGSVGDSAPSATMGSTITTTSGKGGDGGGGAGAGIGTNGGYGGIGGAAKSLTVEAAKYNSGISGETGGNGDTPASAGSLYKANDITITANGGAAGSTPTQSANNSSDSHGKYNGENCDAGASGGGGNGVGGGSAYGMGAGGAGGAGGGSGGTGGITFNRSTAYNPSGGHGGNGNGSAYRGTGDYGGSSEVKGGDGGYGGSNGSSGSAISASLRTLSDYTVTFEGAAANGTMKYCFSDKKIVVPEYTPAAGKAFLGWKVSTYGKTLNTSVEGQELLENDTTLYQYGDEINISNLTYGNIVLKPVVTDIAGKYADDKLEISNTAFNAETTYYTYTVNTKMNDSAADIGTITLKDSGSEEYYVLGGNGAGTYQLVLPENKTFKIIVDGVDTGKTVSSGSENSQVIAKKSITVTTNVDGAPAPLDGEILLVSETESITMTPVVINGQLTGAYRIEKLAEQATGEYKVFAAGKDTGKSVSFGESTGLEYVTAKVTVTGNTAVNSVAIHKTGEMDRTLTLQNGVYELIDLADADSEYKVLVNGLDSGATIAFVSGKNQAAVEMKTLNVTVSLDGAAFDNSAYEPSYKGRAMDRIAAGIYQTVEFGTVGKVKVSGAEKDFSENAAAYNYYSVTYDLNGGNGTLPTDTKYYLEGSTLEVARETGFEKDSQQFAGWTLGGTGALIAAGAKIQVTGTMNLVAQYKTRDQFPVVLLVDGNPIYCYPDDISRYIEDRGDKTLPDITVTLNEDCTDSNPVVLPDLQLGANDTLIVPSGKTVTIPGTLRNSGRIENNGTLNVSGTVQNAGEIENKGTLNVTGSVNNLSEGSFVNHMGGTTRIATGGSLTNESKKPKGIKNQGSIEINGGTLENKKNGYIDNEGTITLNSGQFINAGNIDNSGTLGGSSSKEIRNSGLIQDPCKLGKTGTITVPVNNENGIVAGGKVEGNGTIRGGSADAVENKTSTPFTGTSNAPGGSLETPVSGGTIPANPTQADINSVFGTGNAELIEDGNGGYTVAVKKGVKLEHPIVIADGANVTIDLLGNDITGPDGGNAIEVGNNNTNGSLTLKDSVGGGRVIGGTGTTAGSGTGTGTGGTGIVLAGNGHLFVDDEVTVRGGTGVNGGAGGTGIYVNLNRDENGNGDGDAFIYGTAAGGNGGSGLADENGNSVAGNGGAGIEIVSAPDNAVVIGPGRKIGGGDGGKSTDADGTVVKPASDGAKTQTADDAAGALKQESISNADGIKITLLNSLTYTGGKQTQRIEVLFNGETVDPADYIIEKNQNTNAGTYILRIIFNDVIDAGSESTPGKPYAHLAGKRYYQQYTIRGPESGSSVITKPAEDYKVPVTNENKVHVDAAISNGQAEISEITESMIAQITNGKGTQSAIDTITIDLSGAKQEVTGVTISKTTVETLAAATAKKENGIETVTIELSKVTVVLDSKTLKTLAADAKGTDIQLVVEDTEHKNLNTTQQTALKNHQVAATFEAYFVSGGQRIHDFKGGSAVVSVKFTPQAGKDANYYHMVYVSDDGKLTRYKTKYENGRLMFTATHFSDYAIIYDETEKNDTEQTQLTDAERIRALKGFKLVARSKMSWLGNDRSVRVRWFDKNGKDLGDFGFDGYEIWRSVKRNTGYGKKPFFVTKKEFYHNDRIEAGKKYYYRVRGFITVDGKKYYTDWSLKAWRTIDKDENMHR